MTESKKVIQAFFEDADIRVNGPAPWDIQVIDERFYPRVMRDKSLGFGESYMDRWWDCQRVDELVFRLLKSGIQKKAKGNWRFFLAALLARLFNRQTKIRSNEVVRRHYDLDNGLFMTFLDPFNQYSCGYFDSADGLPEAQIKKMELIATKLGLTAGDHVLDIGSGWGGFCRFVAENYGCSVTGVNISREQNSFARENCKGLPVRIRQCDYRDIEGRYDKIVSVGMFEHVGYKNYQTFMDTAYRCLKEDGVFLLHTIGGNESRANCDPWINRYIFPNGNLPSIAQISRVVEGLFVMEDVHNLGPHYDKTLMAWHDNFQKAWPELENKYDDRFKRMWEYYLLTCAGAFRARDLQIWQMVFTHCGAGQPCCR